MNGILFTILFLAFLTAAFFAWYFTHKSREKERLIMLEKGMDLPQNPAQKTTGFTFPWLKIGLVITSLTLGLMLGILLHEMRLYYLGPPPVLMIFFGGIGMIVAHFVDKKND